VLQALEVPHEALPRRRRHLLRRRSPLEP
jgi:hypothetical protein